MLGRCTDDDENDQRYTSQTKHGIWMINKRLLGLLGACISLTVAAPQSRVRGSCVNLDASDVLPEPILYVFVHLRSRAATFKGTRQFCCSANPFPRTVFGAGRGGGLCMYQYALKGYPHVGRASLANALPAPCRMMIRM